LTNDNDDTIETLDLIGSCWLMSHGHSYEITTTDNQQGQFPTL